MGSPVSGYVCLVIFLGALFNPDYSNHRDATRGRALIPRAGTFLNACPVMAAIGAGYLISKKRSWFSRCLLWLSRITRQPVFRVGARIVDCCW